jgi:hypothetical protein
VVIFYFFSFGMMEMGSGKTCIFSFLKDFFIWEGIESGKEREKKVENSSPSLPVS